MLQEGSCILSGLGYNGVVDGTHQWDACANMKVWLFETTPYFGGTIASFNINTNAWAARSVRNLCFSELFSELCWKSFILTLLL